MGRGLIQGLVMGVAALVIAVIIAFIVVSNVAVVDDDLAAIISASVINETGGYINSSGYTLNKASLTGFASPVITAIYNATSGVAIATGNASVTSAGVVTNATASTYPTIKISYTYTHTPTTATADNMIVNFTEGVNKVSAKIPTILLIAAVVIVLGILTLLWAQYKKMQIGGAGEL